MYDFIYLFIIIIYFYYFFLQNFCRMINEKLSSISRQKVELENLLKNANTEFPNDEDVLELYNKYGALFKETVALEDLHIDHFEPQDRQDDDSNDRGKKDGDAAKKDVGVDKVVSENVGVDNLVSENVAAKKDDGATKDAEIERELSDEEEPILSQDSFTQWLQDNIDWIGEVIDCIYDAYYDVCIGQFF